MWSGQTNPEEHTLDRCSTIAGLSAAGFTAVIPRFYRSALSLPKASRSLAVTFIAPPLCGSIAYFSWYYLVSNPIKRRKLECVSCASIRGSLILGLSGCVLPSFVVALLNFKRDTSLPQPVITAFVDFCYSPYYGRSKAYIIALGVLQAVLGYGLASWVYTEEFINTRNDSNKLE